MKRIRKGFFSAALLSFFYGISARADAAPIFNITPSAEALVQGQSLTLNVTAASNYVGYNLFVSARLDGQGISVQHPTPSTWTVVAGPFNSLGTHLVNLSLSLENSENSRKATKSIYALNNKIVIINNEIAAATDLKIKAALVNELASQKNLLSMVQGQLESLRTAVGDQDYSFNVGANSSNPNYPIVSSITPNAGSISGGTSLTITGTNFASGASVLVGGVPATSVTVVNATTISALTPKLSSVGAKDIEVDLPPISGSDSRNSLLPNSYYAVPDSLPTPTNPPVAVTSGSQVFLLGNSVSIDGSQSFDWGGDGLNYLWNFISTPSGSSFQSGYAFPNAPGISFTPDAYGTYVLQLVVQQNGVVSPLSSAASLAVVSVIGAPAPTAQAIQVVTGLNGTSQISAHDPSLSIGEAYVLLSAPQHGSVSLNAQGLATYLANSGYSGADTFSVRVINQYGLAGIVNISVLVLASTSADCTECSEH